MKRISRLLGTASFSFALALSASGAETPSLQEIYDEHKAEILAALSESGKPFKGSGCVFVSGSSAVLDSEEDEEHARSVARLEAEASVIDVFFDEVDWPDRIPIGLRQQLWNYYRSQTNTFSLKGAEVVEVFDGEGVVGVVLGVRKSKIEFNPPSYETLVQAIEK